jgi:hypothetical protein
MPEIIIRFNELSNKSMQVGDILYYTEVTEASNGITSNSGESHKIGAIKDFRYEPQDIATTTTDSEGVETTTYEGNWIIIADLDVSVPPPTSNDFFYFKKNPVVEKSGVKGYYAKVSFNGHVKQAAEVFSFGCNVSESSK